MYIRAENAFAVHNMLQFAVRGANIHSAYSNIMYIRAENATHSLFIMYIRAVMCE